MLRSLAIRLVLWLCQRFDITVIDEQRRMIGADAIDRAVRWEAFYLEQGGLADMLADIRREAFEHASELDPGETDKIYYWATADRNVRKLEQRVRSVIAHGKIEARQAELKQSVGNPRKSVY